MSHHFAIRCLAGFVLAAFAAFAADDAAPRLVTLNVTATDAQGRAVSDLTAADLQITDQGQAVPIAAFRNQALHTPATAPGPGLFTNQPAPAVSRVQVVLFDVLNLSMSSRKPAMEQIVRALESLEKSDSVYLYLLNQRDKMSRGGMRLGHDVLVVETIRKIRLLVLDRFGKFAGTVTIPIS